MMRSSAYPVACLIAHCLTATFVLVFGGCDKGSDDARVVRREGEPDYVKPADEALMDRAIQKARATHQTFVAALQNPKASYSALAVKKGFPTPDGANEHMWLIEPSWDGTQFSGIVNNEPVDTKAVKIGDRATVRPDELSDWMYVDGKRVVGGYTLRALHHASAPEERKAFEKETGLEVPPVDF